MNDTYDTEPFDDDHTISVDDAVLDIIGIQCERFQDTGEEIIEISLADIMEDYLEHATINLHNAKFELELHQRSDGSDKRTLMKLKSEVSDKGKEYEEVSAKHQRAGKLSRALKDEAAKAIAGKDSILVVDQIESNKAKDYRITVSSFLRWKESLGQHSVNSERTSNLIETPNRAKPPNQINWEDVRIKLLRSYRLSYSYQKERSSSVSFQELGFIDKRRNEPNMLGKTFIIMAQGERVPNGYTTDNATASRISKIGKILRDHIGINTKPFKSFNPVDGYLPRFTLIDDRSNSEGRLFKSTQTIDYNQVLEKEGLALYQGNEIETSEEEAVRGEEENEDFKENQDY